MDIQNISDDVLLYKITSLLNIRDIINIYATNKNLKKRFDNFWIKIAKQKFNLTQKPKNETWPQFLLKTEYQNEIRVRFKDLVDYMSIREDLNTSIKETKKYISYYMSITRDIRVNKETGDVSRTVGKILFNILKDPYIGKLYVNKWGYLNHYIIIEPTPDMKKYEVIEPYKSDKIEIKSVFTLEELNKYNKSQLICIYKELGLKGYSGKTNSKLIKSILKYEPHKSDYTHKELNKLNKSQLISIYHELGLKGYSRKTKPKLIESILK